MDAFLAEINLAQHATILDKLGYDDPNDFAEFEASDLKKLETRCADEGMPPAHVDKIVRAVKKRSAMAAAAATASVTPPSCRRLGVWAGGGKSVGRSVGQLGRHVCTVAPALPGPGPPVPVPVPSARGVRR